MAEEKKYKIVIARPAQIRYQQTVLLYIYENFSFERATEIDENILSTARTLDKKPNRGSIEKHLDGGKENFRYILYKETKYFEIKIIYYISEDKGTVYVTDFFPTRMNPQRISKNK